MIQREKFSQPHYLIAYVEEHSKLDIGQICEILDIHRMQWWEWKTGVVNIPEWRIAQMTYSFDLSRRTVVQKMLQQWPKEAVALERKRVAVKRAIKRRR